MKSFSALGLELIFPDLICLKGYAYFFSPDEMAGRLHESAPPLNSPSNRYSMKPPEERLSVELDVIMRIVT